MDEIYMNEAIKQAQIAFTKGDVPVGAIIVKDDKIISRAYNKREDSKDPTNHAEIIAIKKACKAINDWRLNGCTMYVTLEPCLMCKGAIEQSRISKVIYGTNNINEHGYQEANYNGGILTEKCSELLKNFFQEVRKI